RTPPSGPPARTCCSPRSPHGRWSRRLSWPASGSASSRVRVQGCCWPRSWVTNLHPLNLNPVSSRPRRSVYVPQDIEPKWQKVWAERGVMRAADDSPQPKYYDLVMYPYPSGDLHMGHARNYVMGDALARMNRWQGCEGLP